MSRELNRSRFRARVGTWACAACCVPVAVVAWIGYLAGWGGDEASFSIAVARSAGKANTPASADHCRLTIRYRSDSDAAPQATVTTLSQPDSVANQPLTHIAFDQKTKTSAPILEYAPGTVLRLTAAPSLGPNGEVFVGWRIPDKTFLSVDHQLEYRLTSNLTVEAVYLPLDRVIHVDATATGAGDGTSWSDAYTTIEAALSEELARDNPDDEIWVAAGTYAESLELAPGQRLYGGFSGASGKRETQRGQRLFAPEADAPSLFVNKAVVTTEAGVHGNHVVVIRDGCVLDGFIIADGRATGTSYPENRGAGILCPSGSQLIRHCLFRGNYAGRHGGALYAVEANPTIVNCIFTGNSANRGGALYCDGLSAVTLENCVFRENTARGSAATDSLTGKGGAIFNDGAALSVETCTFVANQSLDHGDGGAIFNNGLAANGQPTLIANSRFEANNVPGNGGALLNGDGAKPTVVACTFLNNRAQETGGAAFETGSNSGGDYTNCIFKSNHAKQGGAVYCDRATPTFANTAFEGNGVSEHGSGAGVHNQAGTVDFKRCRFTGNRADLGAALACRRGDEPVKGRSGSAVVDACIFQSNHSQNRGGAIDVGQRCEMRISNSRFGHGTDRSKRNSAGHADDSSAVSTNGPAFGGSIYNGGALTVSNTAFFDSLAPSGGGAIHSVDDGYLVIEKGCAFSRCTTGGNGGAIASLDRASIHVSDSTFSYNEAGSASVGDGGAIHHSGSGKATFNRCTFTGNQADRGGAMAGHAPVTISHSTFTGNLAASDDHMAAGGALTVSGGRIDACTFENNAATDRGGAIYDDGSATTFASCSFKKNTARIGGGAYGGALTTCEFRFNSAVSSGGGAAHATLRHCTVSENVSSGDGGGGASLLAINTLFENNRAEDSGGGCHEGDYFNCRVMENKAAYGAGLAGKGTAVNTVISNNVASTTAGAAYLYGTSNETLSLIHCTIADNKADSETGGVFASTHGQGHTRVVIRNTIIWGNRCASTTDATDPSHELRTGQADLDVAHSAIRNFPKSTGIAKDQAPRFFNSNDGNFRLQTDSPCIDSGMPLDTQRFGNRVLADIDGAVRDARPDMGAYESAGAVPEIAVYADQGVSSTNRRGVVQAAFGYVDPGMHSNTTLAEGVVTDVTTTGAIVRADAEAKMLEWERDLPDVDNLFAGYVVEITSGAAKGQRWKIREYDGNARRARVDGDWSEVPDETSSFKIRLNPNQVQLGADASRTDDAYNGMAIRDLTRPANAKRMIVDYDGATRIATLDSPWDSPLRHYRISTEVPLTAGSTALHLAPGASTVDDAYNGRYVKITAAKGGTYVRRISDYDGKTRSASLTGIDGCDPATIDEASPVTYQLYTGTWFTIENTGIGDLALAAPLVATEPASGKRSADFAVLSQPTNTIASGQRTRFLVGFHPLSHDDSAHAATVTIYSNEPDESPVVVNLVGFDAAPGPAMEIRTATGKIVNQNGLATLDMGEVNWRDGSATVPLEVHNVGSGDLILGGETGIQLSGDTADFTLAQCPVRQAIPPGDYYTIDTTFDPTDVGRRTAALEFRSNDSQSPSRRLILRGVGAGPRALIVADDDGNRVTDFGSAGHGHGSVTRTFSLVNVGTQTLSLLSTPSVVIHAVSEGGWPADEEVTSLPTSANFTVVNQPATQVPPHLGTSFSVRYTPSRRAGAHRAVAQIATDAGVQTFRMQAVTPNASQPPKAFISSDLSPNAKTGLYVATAGATVNLYGSVPSGDDWDQLTFSWAASPNNPAELNTTQVPGGSNLSVDFTDAVDGVYRFSLTVADGVTSQSATTEFIIYVGAVPVINVSSEIWENEGTVTGRVTDPLGNPLEGVDIFVTPASEMLSADLVTKADGSFSLTTADDPFADGDQSLVISATRPKSGLGNAKATTLRDDDAPAMALYAGSGKMKDGGRAVVAFGTAIADDTPVRREFVIGNESPTVALTIESVSISGTNASDFTLASRPPETIPPTKTGGFSIAFKPIGDTLGRRHATVTVRGNDPDAPAFSFTVHGVNGNAAKLSVAYVSPHGQIDVPPQVNASPINQGTAFGTVVVGRDEARSFVIRNDGGRPLELNHDPCIMITGDHPADFTIRRLPVSPTFVAPGGSVGFDVVFCPKGSGERNAVIWIPGGHGDDLPYRFVVSGRGRAKRPPVTDMSARANQPLAATHTVPVMNSQVAAKAGGGSCAISERTTPMGWLPMLCLMVTVLGIRMRRRHGSAS